MPVGLVTLTSVSQRPMTFEADEAEPAGEELGREALADLAVARVERGALGAPARRQVAAEVGAARDAQDGAERLAVEQQDALVAAAALRRPRLGDDRERAAVRRRLQDRGEVGARGAEAEDAAAAVG